MRGAAGWRFLPGAAAVSGEATVLDEPDYVNVLISRCSGTLRARGRPSMSDRGGLRCQLPTVRPLGS
jgi:hypothetical protein